MRIKAYLLSALLLTAGSRTAHASQIDDLTLTGGGNTIVWSLPATSSYPDFSLFNFFNESGPATIDGTPGYSLSGEIYLPGLMYPELILNTPSSIFGGPNLQLFGSPFFTYTTVAASNPYPYLPYDIVPTFTPGTYTLQTGFESATYPDVYTLTITPETTATPEPSSLLLFATGALGLFVVLRRRSDPFSPGR